MPAAVLSSSCAGDNYFTTLIEKVAVEHENEVVDEQAEGVDDDDDVFAQIFGEINYTHLHW